MKVTLTEAAQLQILETVEKFGLSSFDWRLRLSLETSGWQACLTDDPLNDETTSTVDDIKVGVPRAARDKPISVDFLDHQHAYGFVVSVIQASPF